MAVVNEISLNIEKVLKELLPEQKNKALNKAGQMVENKAKEKCGVDTSTLRNSITHQATEDRVDIGTNVEYAPYHHNNNPFLQDALEENLKDVEKCFNDLLKE